MIKRQNVSLVIAHVMVTTLSIQSEPRISRNEYSAHYPEHPFIFRVEAGDLKYLPRITFDLNTTSESMITWPWDIVGACGAFLTIYSCNGEKSPYTVLWSGMLSLLTPVFPRWFNYMTSPATTSSPDNPHDNQE